MDPSSSTEPAPDKAAPSEQSAPQSDVSPYALKRARQERDERERPRDNEGKRQKYDNKFSRSRSGRGGSNKEKNMGNRDRNSGRGAYFRENADKKTRNEETIQKREQDVSEGKERPIYVADNFSKDEIASEDRRPKRKVAVMLGYSGSGYRGMQIMPDQRTIEGDLFQAFVTAGAISKANADDPKKSGLVRCARTDKGVHAAGNVISLKLIIEDPDIVQKINALLSPQIRVWGIQRTTGSFSCYAACDSRWYEYLIPTHCLLPPHPSSFLGKKLVEIAEEDGLLEELKERQSEVAGFWEQVEAEHIRPVLEKLDAQTRELVEKVLYHNQSSTLELEEDEEDPDAVKEAVNLTDLTAAEETEVAGESGRASLTTKGEDPVLDAAITSLKAAYISAKRTYRIPAARMDRLREALSKYVGTHNFHNFTVRKSPMDPSSKRHIKSFKIAAQPILIEGTEWLSLKVHGQSFMMHQIRKMVAMAALVVRCGCTPERVTEAMTYDIYSIPKAPGLGLLLERPVFDNYNDKASGFDRESIDFDRYKKELEEFKQREIYDRIFQEEEKDHVYHAFFSQLDNFRDPAFLFLSSRGHKAAPTLRKVTQNISMSKRELQEARSAKNLGSRYSRQALGPN